MIPDIISNNCNDLFLEGCHLYHMPQHTHNLLNSSMWLIKIKQTFSIFRSTTKNRLQSDDTHVTTHTHTDVETPTLPMMTLISTASRSP